MEELGGDVEMYDLGGHHVSGDDEESKSYPKYIRSSTVIFSDLT